MVKLGMKMRLEQSVPGLLTQDITAEEYGFIIARYATASILLLTRKTGRA